ncbi:MAG: FAD-dependent oxidoreductase [Phycisphaerales bacterium]|nr:FAD-dependent oxidoreductase [Phycisphaerales bacterium]
MAAEHGTEYAVIGAGVAGLTATIELALRGAEVTVYTDTSAAPPASEAAPAVFTPYPGGDPARFQRWTEHAHQTLADLADHEPRSGVEMRELREYFYQRPQRPAWLDELLGTRPIRPIPKPFVEATSSIRAHIDMLTYLPWLRSMAERAGVEFVEQRIASFDQAFRFGHRVILNCAGVGAARLAADALVKPMHGQVVHTRNDIGLTYSLHDDAAGPAGQVAYIFVIDDRLVLGGTFDAGRSDQGTERTAIDGIIQRCRALLRADGHPRWEELGAEGSELRVMAGVRPTRGAAGAFEETRVELQPFGHGRAVVHCYGHGRSGASISWSTAADAVELAMGGE